MLNREVTAWDRRLGDLIAELSGQKRIAERPARAYLWLPRPFSARYPATSVPATTARRPPPRAAVDIRAPQTLG